MKELDYIYKTQKQFLSLRGIEALLGWDEHTHMPEKGSTARAEQAKLVGEEMHALMLDPKLWKAIKSLEKKKLTEHDAHVVNVLRREVIRARKIPKELNSEITYHNSIAFNAWRKAREKDDFKILLPELKKSVALTKKWAKAIDAKKKPYDVLLDEYNEGSNTEKVSEIFATLKPQLVDLLKKIKATEKYKRQKTTIPKISQERQELACRRILKLMQLPKDRTNFSISPHPFTTSISNDDVRITTRYTDIFNSFAATMHEAGHALYELDLPKKYWGTFVSDAPGMAAHESQSIIWEVIGQSEEFWKGYYVKFKKDTGIKMSKSEWYEFYNQIRPSYIRVTADELTYGLHVILRFEIERDLFNGRLKIEDAKKEWNKRFEEMFGIKVKNDNNGILQDMHWATGNFGYFPCYELGRMYAVQLYQTMLGEVKDAKKLIAHQEFAPLIKWLEKKIHSKGRTMLIEEMCEKATGKGLDVSVFVDYLKKKYKKIYGF